MPRSTDPALLALNRILRLVGDLDEAGRAYLVARLSAPPSPRRAEPTPPPKPAAPTPAPAETGDEVSARGFDLVDEVEGTTTTIGGGKRGKGAA